MGFSFSMECNVLVGFRRSMFIIRWKRMCCAHSHVSDCVCVWHGASFHRKHVTKILTSASEKFWLHQKQFQVIWSRADLFSIRMQHIVHIHWISNFEWIFEKNHSKWLHECKVQCTARYKTVHYGIDSGSNKSIDCATDRTSVLN